MYLHTIITLLVSYYFCCLVFASLSALLLLLLLLLLTKRLDWHLVQKLQGYVTRKKRQHFR